MKKVLWAVVLLWLAACAGPQKTATSSLDPHTPGVRQLDTLEVVAEEDMAPEEDATSIPQELPVYQATFNRRNDLLHTRLELRFDWEKEQVLGKAILRLKPLFYATDSLTLDAKNFTINKLTLLQGAKEIPLTYRYANDQLYIKLDRRYTRQEEYQVLIDYVAMPSITGGSAAINADKGLYFINPRGETPGKPTQIWTQGETEANSKWFPTIDKPNERCTQEIFVTVAQRYTTLSNGVLVQSTNNPDGTRTDYWKMDQPHAPYLFMLAIGEYAVVKDTWRNLEVSYYVEPEYRDDARAIFAHTPEMLEFFSNKLGVPYPWKKYAQVVVRDYVSGAMENTTAVIFGDFVQKTKRQLIDDDNDRIVAHEMFHHWFGDLVTTESWANLTLNEGFANYSEYLWLQHKYGNDVADAHLETEQNGYFQSSATSVHPLIHFGYGDKEDMFDAHSYNKGGAVLHMLRTYLGDEAFFAGLNLYLTRHAYRAVEVHDLRLAFEEVTGQDLNWFFNQWYLAAGHPRLNVVSNYAEATQEVVLQVVQEQGDPENNVPYIFELPLQVDVYAGGGKARHSIRINAREQEFRLPCAQKPDLVNFDAERTLLAEINYEKSEAELAFQFRNAPLYRDRQEAIIGLAELESEALPAVAVLALRDPYFGIRTLALENLAEDLDEATVAQLRQMARQDPHSEVRASALSLLADLEDAELKTIATDRLDRDPALPVVGMALQVIAEEDQAAALTYATKLLQEGKGEFDAIIADIYVGTADPQYLSFFEERLDKIDNLEAISFYEGYAELLTKAAEAQIDAATAKLGKTATSNEGSLYRRFASTKALFDLRNFFRSGSKKATNSAEKEKLQAKDIALTAILMEIKKVESHPELKAAYQNLN